MATLKDVKAKISGVKQTQKITRAMNMVAASRLRGAQTKMEAFKPYAAKFREVLGSLAERAGDNTSNPLFIERDEIKQVHIVLFTSDRGLCGGFNSNLLAKTTQLMKDVRAQHPQAQFSFTCFGRKGYSWCLKNNYKIVDTHIGVVGARFDFALASKTGHILIKSFLGEYNDEDCLQYDEVYLIYGSFVRMSLQEAMSQRILPVDIRDAKIADDHAAAVATEEALEHAATGYSRDTYLPEHLCEPSEKELLGEMLPRNIYVQIYNALLETSASEHAARMFAMENATKACKDIISNLQLSYNKARQAAITSELIDIVGGAGALQG